MEKEILQLINEKKYNRLRSLLSEMNPTDIAFILNETEILDLPVLFRILPKDTASEVFVEMDTNLQQMLIEAFSDKEIRAVFDQLFMDDTVDIIDEMPANVAKRILKNTDAQTRKTINQILAYPDYSSGSIMTTEYINLKKDMTVEEAFKRIRKVGINAETIYTCYVTDESRKLLGIITVKDLLLNDKLSIISDLMDENVIYANTLDDKEEVARLFKKYDLYALPIVDKENRLVGIVTVDDAIDVMQEEVTEDIEKMAAIMPTERAYFKTSVLSIFKSRIPWLMLLMLSATFTGAIISSFEAKLTLFPALIAFIPMLMGTAGNSGSQSSVTIIRSLSLGEVNFKDIFKILWKELRISFFCGVALAVVNFIKMWIIDYRLLKTFDDGIHLLEILVVSISLLFTVIIAKIFGAVLPLLAKKIGFDPAVMASPFITTVVDALSLITYFGIAVFLLK